MILAMVTLACAFLGSNSTNSVAIQTRLPTLTRTPLPTLTPTASVSGAPPELAKPTDPVVQPIPEISHSDTPADGVATAAPIRVVETPTAPTQSSPTNSPGVQPQQIANLPSTSIPTEALPASPPTATSTDTPLPTFTPAAVPTETPLPAGWVFSNVRVTLDQAGENLLLFGDVENITGVSQELAYITGIFFDAQNQVIAGEENIFDYWPIDVVPPGGQIPFELIVANIQNATSFDLSVEAEPSNQLPRQDFEFINANISNAAGEYCATGRLRNPGGILEQDLVIVVVLYDNQDKIVNYGEHYEPFPQAVIGDETLDFEVCSELVNQEIARYELRAWGG